MILSLGLFVVVEASTISSLSKDSKTDFKTEQCEVVKQVNETAFTIHNMEFQANYDVLVNVKPITFDYDLIHVEKSVLYYNHYKECIRPGYLKPPDSRSV